MLILPQAIDGKFYLPSNLGERLMLPTKYLDDLKNAPVDKVDFVATFFEVGMNGIDVALAADKCTDV